MCGIIGYVGYRPAVPLVMEGLSRLEYRGYDSAGVAWMQGDKIRLAKARGKLVNLAEKLSKMPAITSTCAMGHTRWATHGVPNETNAHPHFSNEQDFALVHNGIIENYQHLKEKLGREGYTFYSDTDTEILVNLIASKMKNSGSVLEAFAQAIEEAEGAYALCLMSVYAPGRIFAARKSAPLIVGKGLNETFIASDVPAFLPFTRDVVFVRDNEIVEADEERLLVYSSAPKLEIIPKETEKIQWDMQAAQKDGYKHFMLKEIFEQPRVIRDGLSGRLKDGKISLPELDKLPIPDRLHIIACGTSYHSGLWAKQLFETLAAIPVDVEIASESRYKPRMIFGDNDLAIFISQSGETADTLAAMRRIKDMDVTALGLCNVLGSSLAREADITLYTQAGPEISVASTKAMTSQMLLLMLLALYWGEKKGLIPNEEYKDLVRQLEKLPRILDDNLPEMRKYATEIARQYASFKHFFYLGRGLNYPLALEGALKLKELSYIHAEGYGAGEMKHGPIALIDPHFPSFVIAVEDGLLDKIKSNIQEIMARGGKVIALTNSDKPLGEDSRWQLPPLKGYNLSFLILPVLQLFSYEVADYLGKDVDQPRNLAKSVTVE